ncbi:MAG: Calx-beta domain-containing protein, partial [Rubripirellula sp.]
MTITDKENVVATDQMQVYVNVLPTEVRIDATDPSASESTDANADTGQFTISLTHPQTTDTTVNYAITGTAIAGTDYVNVNTAAAVIPAGETEALIDIVAIDDPATGLVEVDETVAISLTGTSDPLVQVDASAQSAIVTIYDDDSATVSISATDTDASETLPSDPANPGVFTLWLSSPSATDTSINYTIQTASEPSEYDPLPATLVIPAGQTAVDVPLNIVDDDLAELGEGFQLTLTSIALGDDDISLATTGVDASLIVADNDNAVVSISAISDASESGAVPGTFLVSLSNPTVASTTIGYSVSGEVDNSDYTSVSQIQIPAGQQSAVLELIPIDDDLIEGHEDLAVELTAVVIGLAGTVIDVNQKQDTIQILDNDLGIISVNTTDAAEDGSVNGLITVSMDRTINVPVTVSLSVTDQTATSGVDYQALSAPLTITIPANSLEASTVVTVIDDLSYEADETLLVALTASDNPLTSISSTQNTSTLTILDNDLDQRPLIQFDATQSLTGLILQDGKHATLVIDEDFDPDLISDQIAYTVGDAQTVTVSAATLPVVFTANAILGDTDLFPASPPVIATGEGSARSFITHPNADKYGVTEIVAQVTDADGNQDSLTLTVTVNPVNDVPVVTSGIELSIEENLATGTPIGTPLSATDVEGETLSNWRIEGNDFGHFQIDASTGQLSVKPGADIDFDVLPPATPYFDILVSVTDGTAADDTDRSAHEAVRIHVTDLNDTSPVVDPAGPFGILEGSPVNTIVAGGLSASDVDTVGAIVAWEVESGDDEGMFALTADSDPTTATLSVARPDLDFEYAPQSYSLGLVAIDDAGNRSLPQTVVVNLIDDASEPAEISISDSDGNKLVNNGTFDFGVVNDDVSDPASSTTSQTFTVRNHGNVDLNLDPSGNVVPSGFQVSGVTPGNVVQPGATAQFTITFTASTVGTINDSIHVANDDANDNPFRINALVTVDPANHPPALFTTNELAVAGPVVLGSYLGRLPAYDPDGDFLEFSLTNNTGGDALPDGLISVDPDTGDLYLADIELLPAAGIIGSIAFSAREQSTSLTTSGSLTLTLPGRKDVLGDDFRDNASHRDEIIFDLRPTSVAADGQTLYTTLLINDQPLGIGQSHDDTVGSYTYGTYHVDEAGFVRYTPNPTLYQDRQTEFVASSDDDADEGITFLDRPEITLVLVADNSSIGPANTTSSPSSDVDVLATRKSTPALQNTQPVAIATGEASGLLSPLPIFAQMNDLFSIDLSQWFVDPDGDEIIATSAQRIGSELNVETDPANLSQVFIDIVGVENQLFRTFSSGTASIAVSDHIDYLADDRLEFQFKEFEDDLPRYDTAAGISFVEQGDRNDIAVSGGDNDERSFGSDAWRRRWNAWQIQSTVHSVATDDSPDFAVGDASIDLATGQAKVLQALNLNDAFDDLSVSLPGLVYDGNNINNQSIAHLVVHKPVDESRDITGFNVTVERYDHFAGAVSVSPTTLNFTMNVDSADQNADKFSLVVPVIEDHADVLDSGIVRYTLRVEPVFDGAGLSIADDPISLTQAGRIVVVKQTTLDPDDSDTTTPFDSASYSDYSPEFGDGWQLAGLPRLILDRGNPKTGVFYDGSGGNFSLIAVPHVMIQKPGSDDVAVFRGTSAQNGMPYSIDDTTFTPFDTDFGTDDVREYGRLSLAPSIDFGGNVSDYENGMTFSVNGSNDNLGGGSFTYYFEFDDSGFGMGMGDVTVDTSGATSLQDIRDAVYDALTTPWVMNDLGIIPVKVGTTRIQLGGPTGSRVWKDWAPDDMKISGGNKLSYIDGSGTEYLFERFNTEFESRLGEPTPQFLVTEVTPPDGSGIKVEYEDGITGAAIISVNSTGGQNEGPLRIHRITALRDSEDTGSLTFNYVGPTVDSITFGDTRQISFEYTGENLTKVKQPLGVETVYGHTSVGTATGETAKPMLRTIQHQRVTTSPAATVVDDYTEFTYADGAVVTTQRGSTGDTPTISNLQTVHGRNKTAVGVSAPTDGIHVDDALVTSQVATTVSVTTAANLFAHDGTDPVANAGAHVQEYHLDYRGNTLIVDSLYDPVGGGTSDATITSRSMTQFDAFDNPVLAIDPLGRRTQFVYDYTVTPDSSLQGETLHSGETRENIVVIRDDSGLNQFKREGNQLNAMGRLIESIDVLGSRQTLAYDSAGRLETSQAHRDLGGNTQETRQTQTTYTDDSLPHQVISPLGLVTEFIDFDPIHKRLPRTITFTEPDVGAISGRDWQTITTYDAFGYVDT